MRVSFKIANPRLKRIVSFYHLDLATLKLIADRHYFPSELIKLMDDFLEGKLLEILSSYDFKFHLPALLPPIDCNSIAQLDAMPKNVEFILTDSFFLEMFETCNFSSYQKLAGKTHD